MKVILGGIFPFYIVGNLELRRKSGIISGEVQRKECGLWDDHHVFFILEVSAGIIQ